jgi:hypothetical protein
MVTHAHPADFPDDISADREQAGTEAVRQMRQDGLLEFHGSTADKPGSLTLIGPLTADQRDALKHLTSDTVAIDELFEDSQSKWPAEQWKAIQNRRYHFVAWAVYAIVIAFCLTSPRWWPGARKPEAEADTTSEPESPPPVASVS